MLKTDTFASTVASSVLAELLDQTSAITLYNKLSSLTTRNIAATTYHYFKKYDTANSTFAIESILLTDLVEKASLVTLDNRLPTPTKQHELESTLHNTTKYKMVTNTKYTTSASRDKAQDYNSTKMTLSNQNTRKGQKPASINHQFISSTTANLFNIGLIDESLDHSSQQPLDSIKFISSTQLSTPVIFVKSIDTTVIPEINRSSRLLIAIIDSSHSPLIRRIASQEATTRVDSATPISTVAGKLIGRVSRTAGELQYFDSSKMYNKN